MSLLSRAQMLAAQDLKTIDVDVPEWGGPVRLRMLSATERDEFDASISKVTATSRTLDLRNLRARMVARSVVDEEGAAVFTEADAVELGKKSSIAIGRLFEAAQKLNGITPTAVDEAEKNSASVPSAASSSD